MICSSVSRAFFIVRPLHGPVSNRRWRKNPVAGHLQRDGPTGYRFSYRLRQVELGLDQDGDPVTTCLVEPMLPAETGRAAVTEAARKALSVLDQVLAAEGEVRRKPHYPGGNAVPLERWREACLAHGGISASDNPDALARTFRRCRDEIEKARIIVVCDGLVWRVE